MKCKNCNPKIFLGVTIAFLCALQSTVFADSNDWAVEVIEYVQGINCHTNFPGYTNAVVALGEASRTTSNGIVDVTFAPWKSSQIVSIGYGGLLYLKMGRKIFDDDDPIHPYGVDLIVYGNSFFVVDDWNQKYFKPWYQISSEPAEIWVSNDISNWFRSPVFADSLFPTQSIDIEGNLSDYLMPVNPDLLTNDWINQGDGDFLWNYTNTVEAYDGAAGGAPVDLSKLEDEHGNPTNIPWIIFVKIVDKNDGTSAEIDAVAAVRSLPEPTLFWILDFGFWIFFLSFRKFNF